MSPNVKKALIIGTIVFVLFFLITQPTQAADAVRAVFCWLQEGVEAIVTFLQALFD